MIISSDIKIVIHRFITRMILTTSLGRKSKTIVLNCTRLVKITMIVSMDSTIARIPEITDPFRVDWHRQQELTRGFGISNVFCLELKMQEILLVYNNICSQYLANLSLIKLSELESYKYFG